MYSNVVEEKGRRGNVKIYNDFQTQSHFTVWLSNDRKLLKTCRQHPMVNCLDWNRQRWTIIRKAQQLPSLREVKLFIFIIKLWRKNIVLRIACRLHVFPRFTWRAFITCIHFCSPFKCWIVKSFGHPCRLCFFLLFFFLIYSRSLLFNRFDSSH